MLQHNWMLMLIKQHMSERTQVLWTTWRTDAIFNICINRYDQLISYQCHNGPIEAIIFLDAPASIEVTQVSESMSESVIVSN